MNFSEHLAKHDVTNLFYMTTLDNLESILKRGILCRRSAGKYPYNDISSNSVQSRRVKYHSFVQLFFADNTPMIYVCTDSNSEQCRKIILLEIASEVANCTGVVFFDGNAAAHETQQYNDPRDLNKLDWKIIFSPRGAWGEQWKRIRAAEIHIPECCPASCIQGVYFQSRLTGGHSKITKILNEFPALHKIFVKDSLTSTGIE